MSGAKEMLLFQIMTMFPDEVAACEWFEQAV